MGWVGKGLVHLGPKMPPPARSPAAIGCAADERHARSRIHRSPFLPPWPSIVRDVLVHAVHHVLTLWPFVHSCRVFEAWDIVCPTLPFYILHSFMKSHACFSALNMAAISALVAAGSFDVGCALTTASAGLCLAFHLDAWA